MNREEHILKRLLKAASQSRRATPETMPFSTEARILTGWCSSVPEEETSSLVSFFSTSGPLCGSHHDREHRLEPV